MTALRKIKPAPQEGLLAQLGQVIEPQADGCT
jgi:hypothetical protein